MTIEGLQKARMNSKKHATVIMNPRPSTWGKTIEFIVSVRKFIIANPKEVCAIVVKNKKKWEKILVDAGIPRERFEFVKFPEERSQIKEVVLDGEVQK